MPRTSLIQKVELIVSELGLDPSLAHAPMRALKAAYEVLDQRPEGNLNAQADNLLKQIGA